MRRFLLIIAFVAAGAAHADFPKEVEVVGRPLALLSVAEARKLGYALEDVPWKENALRVYLEARDALNVMDHRLDMVIYEARKTYDFGEHIEALEAHFRSNKRVFELIAQADAMPRCVVPVPREVMELLSTAPISALGLELSSRAVFAFAKGEHADAVRFCFQGMTLGERAAAGPALVDWLSGVAAQGRQMRALDAMVASGRLDDAMLVRISQKLSACERTFPTYADAMRREHLYMLRMMSYYAKHGPKDRVARFKWRMSFTEAWGRRNLEMLFAQVQRQAAMPAWEGLKPKNALARFRKKHEKNWDHITRSCTGAYDQTFLAHVRTRLSRRASLLRIALERYRLANKQYPDKLDALTPKYLATVPVDPFSGKPIRYRREKTDAFTFWSIGEDLKDDEGKHDEKKGLWFSPDVVYTHKPG